MVTGLLEVYSFLVDLYQCRFELKAEVGYWFFADHVEQNCFLFENIVFLFRTLAALVERLRVLGFAENCLNRLLAHQNGYCLFARGYKEPAGRSRIFGTCRIAALDSEVGMSVFAAAVDYFFRSDQLNSKDSKQRSRLEERR